MGLLDGKLLMLRALEPEDLGYLYEWENNTDIWWLSNTLKPFSREVLRQYLQTAHKDLNESRQFRFVICLKTNQEAIGFIDLFDYEPIHKRAGIGILLVHPDIRNKGFGQEALELLCHYAFTVLMLHQVYASVPSDNLPSIRLFTKAGFQQTGTQKDWILTPDKATDIHFFQLLRTEWLSSSS